ncbi:hypothetical protein D3C76_27610 [compost metagenome]
MPVKYRLLKDSTIEPTAKAGTFAYACTKYDYGSASVDTHITGRKHVSLSLKEDGDYPFFTHAEDDLEVIKE